MIIIMIFIFYLSVFLSGKIITSSSCIKKMFEISSETFKNFLTNKQCDECAKTRFFAIQFRVKNFWRKGLSVCLLHLILPRWAPEAKQSIEKTLKCARNNFNKAWRSTLSRAGYGPVMTMVILVIFIMFWWWWWYATAFGRPFPI